jgi:hypothetical protein
MGGGKAIDKAFPAPSSSRAVDDDEAPVGVPAGGERPPAPSPPVIAEEDDDWLERIKGNFAPH